jgi:hypothetical protein
LRLSPFPFCLGFLMSGLMNDHDENYQEPESDGSLEFWIWCEEQMELENDLEIEILPDDER